MNAHEHVSGRSIRTEIIAICTLSVLAIALLAGGIAYQLLKQQQEENALQRVRALADNRAARIEDYMDMHTQHLLEYSGALETAQAMQQLARAFREGIRKEGYQQADKLFRPVFESIRSHWNYYDIFLISTDGDIVFTVAREADFATNLRHGPYRNTGLARAFEEALMLLSPSQTNFSHYAPSGEPAAFLAAPVIRHGKLLGVLAFQLDTDAFYETAGNPNGMGQSGDIILGVRHDNAVLLTAPSRHDPDAAFRRSIPDHAELARPIREATRGITGQGIMQDLRGIPVIAAWEYLPSLNWGLVAKIDRSEAMAGLIDIRNRLLEALFLVLLLVLLVVTWRAGVIIRALQRLTRISTDIAERNHFDIEAPTHTPIREINRLSTSFNQMSAQLAGYQNELEEKVRVRTMELSRLQAAIEQIHDVVVITDRHAVIEYVNPAFEKLSGYKVNEAIGRRANLVKSGKMSAEFYAQMWGTILAGHNWHGHFINRNKAGALYEVDQAISPIKNGKGNITGFVSVQRDVTEERKQQKLLEHTQRLESLGILAGGIAHDFNNLLTTIMGNAGLAYSRTPSDSPIATNLKHIEEASERAADLCKQMLAYSGKGKFVVVPINLSELIHEIMKLLKVSIGKNVSLRTDLDENLPLIEADEAQIQQVIMNLVINASEAINGEHGNIVIHTGVMDADADYLRTAYISAPLPAGRYVFMEISDDGCGMDSETLEKLYDPFFTTKFTGRGLGMSAIIGIVRGHHGAIKVYSEVGKGTTFKTLFPATDGSQTGVLKSMQAEQDTWQGQGRVLVVDDEQSIRRTACLMLENIGFETISAIDGLDAVEIFKQEHEHIDAVLLDMTMPNMDGKAAFREMLLIDPGVRVILCSGYNEQEATSHFAGKGLAGFIQKPYRLDVLRQTLKDIFSKHDDPPATSGPT